MKKRPTSNVQIPEFFHWALDVGRWTLDVLRAKDELLHSPALDGPSREAPRFAAGPRLRIRGPALHTFLRPEKQAQRRRLRKGPQDPFAGERNRGICPVRAGTENPGAGQARLRGGPFARDVRAAFRDRRKRERRFFRTSRDCRSLRRSRDRA